MKLRTARGLIAGNGCTDLAQLATAWVFEPCRFALVRHGASGADGGVPHFEFSSHIGLVKIAGRAEAGAQTRRGFRYIVCCALYASVLTEHSKASAVAIAGKIQLRYRNSTRNVLGYRHALERSRGGARADACFKASHSC